MSPRKLIVASVLALSACATVPTPPAAQATQPTSTCGPQVLFSHDIEPNTDQLLVCRWNASDGKLLCVKPSLDL